MTPDRNLNDEAGRLTDLRRYDVLDTAPEARFDMLTDLVRCVLGVPIAGVRLIDVDRQWFKSIAGLQVCQTSRELSLCARAIQQGQPLIVPDATLDTRFCRNPMVTGIRSYRGILTTFAKLMINLELRQIATSDALTGAMTRSAWIEATQTEILRSRRYGTAASIMVFDIDHFKQVKDVHGHSGGDAVLAMIAQSCLGTLRDGDSWAGSAARNSHCFCRRPMPQGRQRWPNDCANTLPKRSWTWPRVGFASRQVSGSAR